MSRLLTRRRPHRPADCLPLAAILVAYLALSAAYTLASPLYEPTDEIRHFRYVRHLISYRELPVQRADARAQSHHPPLYYVLGALATGWIKIPEEVYYEPPINPYWGYRYWEVSDDNKNQYVHGDGEQFPFHGITLAVRIVRGMTILIGCGVVWLTYRIGRELAPGCRAVAAGAAAMVALNPQFLYLSGAVNNDVPAALCSAAATLVCIRLIRGGPRLGADITLGALYGLALLTKFNLAALLAPIGLAYLLSVWRSRNWKAALRGVAVVLGITALLSGWWFWRNWMLYGDPTGMSKVNELWSGREPSENWWNLWQSLPYLWSSLWGRFGYGQAPLALPAYQAMLGLAVLGLAGYVRRGKCGSSGAQLGLLAVICLTFTAVVFYYILIQPAGAMGRFLFPALPAFACIVALGLARLAPQRWNGLVGAAMAVGMAALACYALFGVLRPAFARPAQVDARELANAPHQLDVQFGDVARLVGYEVSAASVKPGGELVVRVYWQALRRTEQQHVVFAHLLSDAGPMIAQRDTYPGLGRYPTTVWEPGFTFVDTYRVHVPETAYAPDIGYLQVGLYREDGPRLMTDDGEDAVRLQPVEITPLSGAVPNPLEVNFGDRILLAGYSLDRRNAHPGETISLTLYWRALAPMDVNYSVFAHILGAEDQVWGQDDGWPNHGDAPTSVWQTGDLTEDHRQLVVGLTTPPGFYDIEVGLYDAEGNRLPILADDGRWLDNRVLLSRIQVVSP